MDIRDIRKEYHKNELKDGTVSPDPMVQFRRWFDAALNAGVPELNAAALATATPEGIPSVRMVLLKDVDETGFTFFTWLFHFWFSFISSMVFNGSHIGAVAFLRVLRISGIG